MEGNHRKIKAYNKVRNIILQRQLTFINDKIDHGITEIILQEDPLDEVVEMLISRGYMRTGYSSVYYVFNPSMKPLSSLYDHGYHHGWLVGITCGFLAGYMWSIVRDME